MESLFSRALRGTLGNPTLQDVKEDNKRFYGSGSVESRTYNMRKFAGSDIFHGGTYHDRVTGYEGVAYGRAEYMSGCAQILLIPRVKEDGKRPDGEWFDEQRLEDTGANVITLDNGDTPGGPGTPERAPPRC